MTVSAPATVIALMMGELDYMPALNRISTAIVGRAVAVWREQPGSILICESAPMSAEAIRLGVEPSDVLTALPQRRGQTTRLTALWLARSPYACRRALLVTHALHASRSIRIFAKVGVRADAVGLDLPFDADDRDWKLRSARMFSLYNAAAWIYGFSRRWI